MPHGPASSRPRLRGIVTLSIVLVAGLMLGQLGPIERALTENAPASATQATRDGAGFYDAMETYLATGQPNALRALLSPDFVDHVDGQTAQQGLDPLLRQLDDIRAFFPNAQLDAQPLSSSGDIVHFAVALTPAGSGTVAGLPLALSAPIVASETLRLSEGRIVERWDSLQLPIANTPIASITWDPPAATQLLPAIQRITMLTGSAMTLALGATHLVIVEQGTLTIEKTARGTPSSLPTISPPSIHLTGAERLRVFPGSAVVSPGNSPARLTNEGPDVVSALIIRFTGYSSSSDTPLHEPIGVSQNDPGVQIEVLSMATELPNAPGEWTFELSRATLAPETAISHHVVREAELLAVEHGTLTGVLDDCQQHCVQTAEGASALVADRVSLPQGQGLSAGDGAMTAYNAEGQTPTTLLILTLTPPQAGPNRQ